MNDNSGPIRQASIPEQKVPWDPAELKGRTCQVCACYFESINPQDPAKYQGFCRRLPADLHQMRGEVPRLDRNNKPVFKDGKPLMNSEVLNGYLYKVTQREGTCFEGFRPKGTLPGEPANAVLIRALISLSLKAVEKTGVTVPVDVKKLLREMSIDPSEPAT
jgi:hypothetical protein